MIFQCYDLPPTTILHEGQGVFVSTVQICRQDLGEGPEAPFVAAPTAQNFTFYPPEFFSGFLWFGGRMMLIGY